MTKASKYAKILLTLTLLVLAFCCSFNVTSAYFTASSTKSGELKFPNLDVRFLVLKDNDPVDNQSQPIDLYPIGGTVVRGQKFEVSLTPPNGDEPQAAVENIAIRNMANSINAYLRFWIDAYVVTETGEIDKTKNYGQYFLLDIGSSNDYIARGGSNAGATEGNWCYYAIHEMYPHGGADDNTTLNLGNSLMLSESTTDDVFMEEMLGHSLKITLSLEAVQAKNGAFTSEFNDEKGYYNLWE